MRKQANAGEVRSKGGEVMLGSVNWDAQTVIGLSGKREWGHVRGRHLRTALRIMRRWAAVFEGPAACCWIARKPALAETSNVITAVLFSRRKTKCVIGSSSRRRDYIIDCCVKQCTSTRHKNNCYKSAVE